MSELELGEMVAGRYQVRRLTGADEALQVVKAFDERETRTVSLICLQPHLASDISLLKALRPQAEKLAELRHDNLVPCYGFEQTRDRAFWVADSVQGEGLSSILRRSGPFSEPEMADAVLLSVGAGLAHGHAHSVVHGALSSGAVLVRTDGRVLVSEMGMRHSLVRAGVAVNRGASPYIAPEQRSGSIGDARVDMYALAVLYCELLSGGPKIPTEAPARARQALVRALNPDPSGRFESIPEMLEALTGRAAEATVVAVPGLLDLIKVPGPGLKATGRAGLRDAASRLLAFLSEDGEPDDRGSQAPEKKPTAEGALTELAPRVVELTSIPDGAPHGRIARTVNWEHVRSDQARARSLLRAAGEELLARNWDAAIEIGERLIDEGTAESRAAAELLSEARSAKSLLSIVERARTLAAEGAVGQARPMLDEVLAADPRHPEALALMSEIVSPR